ncbi:MAG TPA: roadblock/LC7 domain-containing protein [Planctomycetota bacterium]|mgnify:FL=1|jgi:predicted regulator of Ras-like GTPase activity (Roadblock/LC7/MglB family)|nr:roadblock/LC7 domain-containing protein [Planctomycetota bacterium]HON45914.1 roadblock/LC7 domain-containing protein [Planctomycetota bacterium]HPY74000.1 roadblock/LC7 domain-containing protein [Planctomycetota bacterium]HQB01102.1 roadblock/LC7 domain-containing protein [Planctomycetota bacterium]HRU50754.1 roadblock/LC7 domain-containing protein [Planctomycetota bacterium]
MTEQAKYNQILQELKDQESSIQALALVDEKGKLYASNLPEDIDVDAVSSVPYFAFSMFEKELSKFHSSHLKQIKIQGKEEYILLCSIKKNFLLAIWVATKEKTPQLQQNVASAISKILGA